MITYSTNWMGPIYTKWYEDNNITSQSYSGGRIDIHGLCEEDHWGGQSEWGVNLMKSESWDMLTEFLDNYKTENLVGPDVLIGEFEKETGHKIEWWKDNKRFTFQK